MAVKKSPAKKSRWSQLVAEAKKDYKEPEPYMFDAVEPPVPITAPDSLERTLAMAKLLDVDGNVTAAELEMLLVALIGKDAFPYVWEAIRDEPIEVVNAFVDELNEHFNGEGLDGAKELPGGLQGS
ncbi:hypothetical protein GS415_00740 [Rhodococcus hoagii]|nr:hypothetical protein [Prescottella equi]